MKTPDLSTPIHTVLSTDNGVDHTTAQDGRPL